MAFRVLGLATTAHFGGGAILRIGIGHNYGETASGDPGLGASLRETDVAGAQFGSGGSR